MISVMRIGSTLGRRFASAVVPLAFAAALPLVQWCPLAPAVTLRDCLPGVAWPVSSAAPVPTACGGGSVACPAGAATCAHCPLQRSSPTRCIGAPMGGLGLRPLSPELHPPVVAVALEDVLAPVLEAPRALGHAVEQADARPPTPPWARRPPVRGPPLG